MEIKFWFILFSIQEIFCLFDKEIKMEKPSKVGGLFFRRKNENEFYISNSKTNYVLNIRNGNYKNLSAFIPLNSTIYEPFYLDFNNEKQIYLVDAQTKSNFIKIYDIYNNVYYEYNHVKINKEYKRKYDKWAKKGLLIFVVGIQDNDNNFEFRINEILGTEQYKSQKINITNSDDFIIYTDDNSGTTHTRTIALIFYENKIVMHQWSMNDGALIDYTTDEVVTNELIKQNYIQKIGRDNTIFCGQSVSDVFCHIIKVNIYGGFKSKTLNTPILKGCKSIYKFNAFNNDKYVVSCVNNNNEFVIQLFSSNLKIDYDLYGLVLWKDDINDNFTYDVLQGKQNELVIIRANLQKNQYFIDLFNFIKNSSNLYQLCPDGCQNCYFSRKEMGLKLGNKNIMYENTLNCSLCNFDKNFADNFGDICFSSEKRPDGYEFIEKNQNYSSCDYCCRTKKQNDICDICLNKKGYIYIVDEPNNERCVNKCEGEYKFIKYKENLCTNSCEGQNDCQSFSSYLKLKGESNDYEKNVTNENHTNSSWCLKEC